MNVLLTSCGLETQAIENAFLKMLPKAPSEINAMFIPTAANSPDALEVLPKCLNDLFKCGIKRENVFVYDLYAPVNNEFRDNCDVIYICGGKALKVLTNLVKLSGASLSGSVAEKLPFNSANGGSEKLNEKADKYARKLFPDIASRKPYRVQKIIHKIIQNVGIKPLVKRKGDAYAAVRRRWTELGLLK